jgi:predicted DsbA family dithiol-disulfide isomerase
MAGLDSTEAMQRFVDEYALAFPQAVSEDGSLWARFGVPYQPAWVFVNDDGQATVIQGALPEDELRTLLDELASS